MTEGRRVTVYHFVRPAPDELAAYRLLRELEVRGFRPTLTFAAGESTISLPAGQVERFRSESRDDPHAFGGC